MTHRTGAILQRDGKTFAVVTRMPGGVVTPEALETIAAVARTHQVPMMKLTSGQRVMLIGIPEKDLENSIEIWNPRRKRDCSLCQICPGLPRDRGLQVRGAGLPGTCTGTRREIPWCRIPCKAQVRSFRVSPLLRGELPPGYRTCGNEERLDGNIRRKQRQAAIDRNHDRAGPHQGGCPRSHPPPA